MGNLFTLIVIILSCLGLIKLIEISKGVVDYLLGPIEPGSKWIHKDHDNENPFQDKPLKVEVKEVKNGWVNYRFLNDSTMFQNESNKKIIFKGIYRKIK